MKKNKLRNLLLLLIACIVIGFIAAYFIYSQYIIMEVQEIDMDVMVINHTGVDVGSDALHFGGLTSGYSSGVRKIHIENPYDFQIITTAYLEGEMAPWVTISRNGIVIEPGEYTSLRFTATPPVGTEFGNYTGKVILTHKRVLW